MSPVAAPADKRFRRAHVKPSRRRGLVRRWVRPFVIFGLLTAGGFYLASRGREIVRHARALQIDEIVVRGNARLPAARVRELLSGMVGQNIIWADLAGWQRETVRGLRAAATATINAFFNRDTGLELSVVRARPRAG